MPLTLAQMLALLPDNTAGDISAVDMRDVVTAIVRGQRAPYSVDDADDVWWEGDLLADFTHVDPTGSSTRTEKDGFLSVSYTGQASLDVGCVLKPHTFSIGDRFATHVRSLGKDEDIHAMVFLVLTDGTATSSNMAAAMMYQDLDRVGAWHGTITNLDTQVWARTSVWDWPLAGFHVAIEYEAANTFQVYLSPDGVSWSDFGAASISKTMTPTHFGVGWSIWGGSNPEGLAAFGPICKIA